MSDDIVTRLSTEEMTKAFHKAFPTVMTLEDAMRQALEAANEIDRLNGIVEHLSAQLRLQVKANDKAWEAYKEVVGDE